LIDLILENDDASALPTCGVVFGKATIANDDGRGRGGDRASAYRLICDINSVRLGTALTSVATAFVRVNIIDAAELAALNDLLSDAAHELHILRLPAARLQAGKPDNR
jgi:hypothetical protein